MPEDFANIEKIYDLLAEAIDAARLGSDVPAENEVQFLAKLAFSALLEIGDSSRMQELIANALRDLG